MDETKLEMPEGENMDVWNSLCETDVAYTKRASRGNWQFTDINPAWRMKRLTEIFGPVGIGWGYTIHERWREVWGKAADCCYVRLSLWYVLGGVRYETPEQIGGTQVDYSPDECWKMSITDALGKCAMSLGLAADVYLGTFDTKYRDLHAAPATTPASKPRTAAEAKLANTSSLTSGSGSPQATAGASGVPF